jgi:hypothetical protein
MDRPYATVTSPVWRPVRLPLHTGSTPERGDTMYGRLARSVPTPVLLVATTLPARSVTKIDRRTG